MGNTRGGKEKEVTLVVDILRLVNYNKLKER